MHQVEGEYQSGNTRYFYLNADQSFNYTTWKAPIVWKGFVDNQEVKFTQIDAGACNISCFDWTGFPPNLNSAKKHIAKAIDEAMRIMD